MSLLEIDQLSVEFGAAPVLSDFNLRVEASEICLILGQNGSGKSTLLRACSGLLRPTHGSVTFDKKPLTPSLIGHFGHHSFLYGSMTVQENLALYARLLKVPTPHPEEWLIQDFWDKSVQELSRGQLARVSLCRALHHFPSFLFLDEPTSYLDESAIEFFLQKISEVMKNNPRARAIIATHDSYHLQGLGTRALCLKDGHLMYEQLNVRQVFDWYQESLR